jgi:hypothetical protein
VASTREEEKRTLSRHDLLMGDQGIMLTITNFKAKVCVAHDGTLGHDSHGGGCVLTLTHAIFMQPVKAQVHSVILILYGGPKTFMM